MRELSAELPDDAATAALAARVGAAVDGGLVAYLHGPLGAGKSSFARALLQSMGVAWRIKSPTYSLMESYPLGDAQAWHLDLYRIADPDELEWLGMDALGEAAALVLIEWPERGIGAIPAADLDVFLEYAGTGRHAVLRAASARGEHLLARLSADAAS